MQIYVRVGNGKNEEQVAAPTFTPAAGEYTTAQNVEIASVTPPSRTTELALASRIRERATI